MSASPLWLTSAFDTMASLTAYPPNALLFIDEQRGNAYTLAESYLNNILCLTPQNGYACKQCQSCHLIAQGLHPDYFYYRNKLSINDIRNLNTQIATTPAISQRRAIYLGNIDRYDEAALNALLKTLEEPQRHSHFCLSAPSRLAVKPTIASRARSIRIPQADYEQALQWLIEQGCEADKAGQLLNLHHDNPYTTLEEIQSGKSPPDWQLDKLTAFCLHPQKNSAFLLALENIPDGLVLDWVIAQIEALIAAIQLDKPLETWQNSTATLAELNPVYLHRLYAALCRNRHPARQRPNSAALSVKALLLENLDPRNPLL